MEQEKQLTKPFTIGDEFKTKKEKPFTIEVPKTKLYLILKYYNSNEECVEDMKDYEFFTGTSQELYDHIKVEIEEEPYFDIMKSSVLVDSLKILSLAQRCSVYIFMRDAKETGKIVDNTSFDINDYYYEEGEDNGEEQ